MMTETKNTKAFYNTEIPNGWKIKSLGNIIDIKSGIGFNASEYSYKGIRLLQIEHVGYGKTEWNSSFFLPNDYLEKYRDVVLSENDIVLALNRPVTNGQLKIAILKKVDVPAILYQRVGKLIVKDNDCLPMYLFYNFSESIKKHVERKSIGSDQPFISVIALYKERIIIPPLPEQKAIAQVLSTADAAIHTTEKLIAQKELRKKWLMQQLLTGKKRLKGFGGEWKKLGAGEIFKSITKKGFADEELLSATQDRGMIPRTMLEGRVTMPTTGTEGFKLVEIGDFVISLRSFQGGLEYSYYRGLVSPAYTVLKPKKEINEEFYKQYFKSYEFIGRLATAVIGIRDGKQISYDDFCIVKIPCPSIEEQTAIAQVLQAADKEISLLKAKAEKLREQKKGLMQQLLTGKVRLKIKE